MSTNIVDLLVLASMECTSEVLFPCFKVEDRNNVIRRSKYSLESMNFSPEEFLRDGLSSKELNQIDKSAQNILFQKIEIFQKRVLKRIIRRMEKGFLAPEKNNNDSVLDIIMKIEDSFGEQWALQNGITAAWKSSNETLEVCDHRFSIANELIGASNEAVSEWVWPFARPWIRSTIVLI